MAGLLAGDRAPALAHDRLRAPIRGTVIEEGEHPLQVGAGDLVVASEERDLPALSSTSIRTGAGSSSAWANACSYHPRASIVRPVNRVRSASERFS